MKRGFSNGQYEKIMCFINIFVGDTQSKNINLKKIIIWDLYNNASHTAD